MGVGGERLLRDLGMFCAGLILLVLLWEDNVLAAAVVIAVFAIRVCFTREKGDFTLYVVGAVLGSAAEVVGTHAGIWEYVNPSFLNIPLWLPFAWGYATVLAVRIGRNLSGGNTPHGGS
jgi:uncharacterized membrane protein YoaT (DUF817 family)